MDRTEIPQILDIEFCDACNCAITAGVLCSYGCQYDSFSANERPINVFRYQREQRIKKIRDGVTIDCTGR